MCQRQAEPVDQPVCQAPPHVSANTGYRNYKCHCPRCRTGARDYDNQRRVGRRNGTWRSLVDAQPTLNHLNQLAKVGVGYRRIARAAKLSPEVVRRYMSDTDRPFPKRIRPASAEALLRVTGRDALEAGARVPALGSRRRARALAALGWSLTWQAQQVGVSRTDYANSLIHPQVSAGRAAAIAGLFDRFSGTPGPSSHARLGAQRRGWPPPLAWDDDLDDPRARPSFGRAPRKKTCTNTHPSERKAA